MLGPQLTFDSYIAIFKAFRPQSTYRNHELHNYVIVIFVISRNSQVWIITKIIRSLNGTA